MKPLASDASRARSRGSYIRLKLESSSSKSKGICGFEKMALSRENVWDWEVEG